jgi:hypothetical protein
MQVAGDPHTGYGLSLDEVAACLWGENMHLHAAADQRWAALRALRSAPSTAPMRANIRATGGPMTGPNP